MGRTITPRWWVLWDYSTTDTVIKILDKSLQGKELREDGVVIYE